MSVEKIVHIPENCHWYKQDATPVLEVPYKSKRKDGKTHRSPTLRDAKPEWWLPGVTGVQSAEGPFSFQLKEYNINLAMQAMFDAYSASGPDKPCEEVKALAKDLFEHERNLPMDIGTKFHKTVEMFLVADRDKPGSVQPGDVIDMSDEHYSPICKAIQKIQSVILGSGWKLLDIEVAFSSMKGYAGKVDAVFEHNGYLIIVDWKTANQASFTRQSKGKPYENYCEQLSAYAEGLKSMPEEIAPEWAKLPLGGCVNVLIDTECGNVHFYDWDKDALSRGNDIFTNQLKNWIMRKDYNPAEQMKVRYK